MRQPTTSARSLTRSQTIALVATALGLLSACGFIPVRSSNAPPPPPRVQRVPLGLTVSARLLEFSVPLSEPDTVQTITVRNPTDHAIGIRLITLVQELTDFDQQNDCGAEVAAGSFCTIHVSFQRERSGQRNGRLLLFVDATDRLPPERIQVVLFAPFEGLPPVIR